MAEQITFNWSSLAQLLQLCLDYKAQADKSEQIDLRELATSIGKAVGIENIDSFAQKNLQSVLEKGFGEAFDQESASKFAVLAAGLAKPIMTVLVKFATEKGSPEKVIADLNKIWFENAEKMTAILQDSLGVPKEIADFLSNKFGVYLFSIFSFAAAFKIYQTAAKDAAVARDHRIEVEKLANEAIEQLRLERIEMEKLVGSQLLEKLIPFNEGIKAMDTALISNDDSAYLAANIELQKAFGRKPQFETTSEFENLMSSDKPFKL